MPRLPHFARRALDPFASLTGRLRHRRRRQAVGHRPVRLLHIGVALAFTLMAAVAVAGGLLVAVWKWLGWPAVPKLTLDAKNVLDLVKIALAVVGGIGGAVALVVAYRKQRLAEDDARREDTKLYAERFDKATEKLGSDAPAVRLAGVHALAALADDWPDGRQMCIDVLCAYLRMPPEPNPVEDAAKQATWQAMREVRATIVRVIAAHLRLSAHFSWCSSDLDFTGVVFDHAADFAKSVFSGGTVSFNGAKFSGGTVSFSNATFSGGTVLFFGAKFSGSTVSFSGATFSRGLVSFGGAEFSRSEVSFNGAKFSGSKVIFSSAKFSGGTVSLTRAKFSGGWVRFDRAKFSGGTVAFGATMFSGGTVTFIDATFSGKEVLFIATKFSGATVSFSGAAFSGGKVSFRRAWFSGGMVTFRKAKFSGGAVTFIEPADWSCPPTGLPAEAPGLYLPAPSPVAADQPLSADPDPAGSVSLPDDEAEVAGHSSITDVDGCS